jgi:hypothetical protein
MKNSMNITEVINQNIRSPLGIIGLFVTLVYAIAGWLFAGIIVNLHIALQSILVGFIVIYPCVLLAVFCFLVTKHHHKLYAPIDFRSDEAFHKYSTSSNVGHIVAEYNPALKQELDDLSKAPDKQKSVESITNILGKGALAEELISKHYAEKYGPEEVRKGENRFHDYGWDLVITTGRSKRLMIEVKLLSKNSPLEKIAERAEKAHQLVVNFNNSGSSKERDFLLCAVVNEPSNKIQEIDQRFREIIKTNNYHFAFELFSFTELAEKYISRVD